MVAAIAAALQTRRNEVISPSMKIVIREYIINWEVVYLLIATGIFITLTCMRAEG